MALYQRKSGILYAKISISGRKPVRFSTGTKDRRKAQEVHDKKQAELWRLVRLGEKPRRTWDEAALRWLQEKKDKRTYDLDRMYIKWFTKHLRGLALDEITRELVDDLIIRHKGDSSPRTKDAYMGIVRSILRAAHREWQWIDHVPPFRTYQKRRDRMGRIRWLTPEEVQRLFAELPRHTIAVVMFSLATGLRMSNALGLRWPNVDLGRRVAYIEQTKNDDPLTVPLNAQALTVLECLRGEHPVYVFSYKGAPIKRTNQRAWRKALQRAGISNFRWHDLRHTWASWLRQNGVPTWALQQLAGWRTAEMADRYAHTSVDHLRPYAEAASTIVDTPEIRRMLGNG